VPIIERQGLRAGNFSFPADHLGYTIRRYYVDEFHFRHVPALLPGSWVLDLGGNKVRKRGQFDVESPAQLPKSVNEE